VDYWILEGQEAVAKASNHPRTVATTKTSDNLVKKRGENKSLSFDALVGVFTLHAVLLGLCFFPVRKFYFLMISMNILIDTF